MEGKLMFKHLIHSIGLIFLVISSLIISGCSSENVLRIGSKNYTEQMILGEMMALLIEAKTDIPVEKIMNLGGTMICHQALVNNRIDLYPEYTGTGYISVLGKDEILSSEQTLRHVREAYQSEFQCTWLPPFGFDNTYAITVRQDDANASNWNTISDLQPRADELHAGFTAEFSERQDGYPLFREHYGFAFGQVTDLDPGLMYSAIYENEVDLISAFATDGRILEYNLQVLEDDKSFFPPYDAAPVVRNDALKRFPALKETLELLHNKIGRQTMQQLNLSVDSGKVSPFEAAKNFLLENGLLQ